MAALPVLLAVLGTVLPGVHGDLEVFASPLKATLAQGGSIQVNCSFSGCDLKDFVLGLETDFSKVLVDSGTNWKLFNLSDIDRDSSPICYLSCGSGRQTTTVVSLTVYVFPEEVQLGPLPSWQPVGEDLTLRCLVVGGAPRNRLTAVLLRDEEELSRQPVIGEPAEVTATVLVGRGDHGAHFSCRTELDLRAEGPGLFLNTSAARQLRTFVLPATPPEFAAPRVLEAGSRQPVTCSLDGLFPALEAQVHLALGDRRLNATVTYGRDSLSATASLEVTAQEEGDQRLVCAVLLGNRSLESWRNLTVYSFPEPILTLNVTEASEGDLVMVSCEAHPGSNVTLSGAPAQPLPHKARLLLNARAGDNGRVFSCSASLEVAGQVLFKNQGQKLAVLYGPRLDDSDCPGNWTFPEGSEQTLRCQAWGNPFPKLRCHRKGDNTSLPIGHLRPVRRELAGTYVCRAVSLRGEASREVLVTVLYNQKNTVIVIVLLAVAAIVSLVALTAYFYNRQRKISKYRLQKAAEKASKLKALGVPAPDCPDLASSQLQQV